MKLKIKTFFILILSVLMMIPTGIQRIYANQFETLEISHKQTVGDINKFTFSPNWDVNGAQTHTWTSGVTAANASEYWYTVDFEGSEIEIHAEKNVALGKIKYTIDEGTPSQQEQIIDLYAT